MADLRTSVRSRPFGITPDGSVAQLFTLSNDVLTLEVTTYGGRLVALRAPDRAGNVSDVVLGYPGVEPYTEDTAFLGCTVGRYANRIANGRFALDGTTYELSRNDGANTLHGGAGGLWSRNWEGRALEDGIELTLNSPDGEDGFPGNVSVTASYRLHGNTVELGYQATTDQPTVLNLTNHAYWNLAGEGADTVLDHEVQIEADAFTPIDAQAIPLGGDRAVEGTPFDFRQLRAISERIREADTQLENGRGYDHNFVLRGEPGALRTAATVVHGPTGRKLEVLTTEPGVQFYSGNYLDGSTVGKNGSPYLWRSALCLETQHFPDSPNQAGFPTTVVRPGETLRSATRWVLTTV